MNAAVKIAARHCLLLVLCWGQTGCLLPQPDTPPIPPVFRPGGPGLPVAAPPAESLNAAPARADGTPLPEAGVDMAPGAGARATEKADTSLGLGGSELVPVAGAIAGDATSGDAPTGISPGPALPVAASTQATEVASGSVTASNTRRSEAEMPQD